MNRCLWIFGCSVFLLIISGAKADARPQYRKVVDTMEAQTDAEKALQANVKKDKCNHCHVKDENKKIRSEYGIKLHDALGNGDKANYKFDKKLWKTGEGGKYSDEAIKLLRDAINNAAK